MSTYCAVDLNDKCVNKYAKCNKKQEEVFAILGESYKHKLALPTKTVVIPDAARGTPSSGTYPEKLTRATDPATPLCLSSHDETYIDWTALHYLQGTNSLITGLVFGYVTLIAASLLVCQMSLSMHESPATGSGVATSSLTTATPTTTTTSAPSSEPTTSHQPPVSVQIENRINPLTQKIGRRPSKKQPREQEMAPITPAAAIHVPPVAPKPPPARKTAVAKPPVAPTPPSAPKPPESLPEGWAEFEQDDTGTKYYYNETSGETVWVKPTK